MEDRILQFQSVCKEYLFSLGLNDLRSYGRYLQLQTPTKSTKGDLIDEILQVLCGEKHPQRNKRGAPVKNAGVDGNIVSYVETLKERFFQKSDAQMVEKPEMDKTASKEKLQEYSGSGEKVEEKAPPAVLTVNLTELNDEQKQLLNAFLNSL